MFRKLNSVRKSVFFLLGWFVLLIALTGCEQDPTLEFTKERSTADLEGLFLTLDPDTVDFPVKVTFAIDFSGSMDEADPDDKRMEAVRRFIDLNEAADLENVSYNIILWNHNILGESTDAWTRDPIEINTALRNGANGGTTDYNGVLDEVYNDIEKDSNREQSVTLRRTKHIVIFLSDGLPFTGSTVDYDEIVQDVVDIRTLTTDKGVGSFSFHTFLLDGGFDDDTAEDDREEAEDLLREMAIAGDGTFTLFNNAESIDFIGLVDFRLSVEYLVKCIYVYNRNSIPGTESPILDTDGDGLSDEQELDASWGSNPLVRDSDDDGLSDYVEFTLQTPDTPFNPNTNLVDPDGDGPLEADPADNNCIPGIGGIWGDTDGDLLNNCEEEIIGTNGRIVDSDSDCIPDGVEFLSGTNWLAPEDVVDTDFDGRTNPQEVRERTNPNADDPDMKRYYAYDYHLVDRGLQPVQQGSGNNVVQSVRRLWEIAVSNITLMDVGVNPITNERYEVETGQDVDFEYGVNEIVVFIGQVAADRPDDTPFFSKVTFKVDINADNNPSGSRQMEFHSDELEGLSGYFSLPLNDIN